MEEVDKSLTSTQDDITYLKIPLLKYEIERHVHKQLFFVNSYIVKI